MLVPPSRALVFAVVAFAPSIMLTVPKTPTRRMTIETRTSTRVMPRSSWRAGGRAIPLGIGRPRRELDARRMGLATSLGKKRGGPVGPPLERSARVVRYHTPPALHPPWLALVQLRVTAPPFTFWIWKLVPDWEWPTMV